MGKEKSILIVMLICLTGSLSTVLAGMSQRQSYSLNGSWFLKQVDTQGLNIPSLSQEARQPGKEWLRTDMPRQVADVLLNYGRFPDPVLRKNWNEGKNV